MIAADTTLSEITLSPAYRGIQRRLGAWLDAGRAAGADGSAFALRAALGSLEPVDHDRLSRWLAWRCVAAAIHGDSQLPARLTRLDAALGRAVRAAMDKLPGVGAHDRRLRLSA